MRQQDPGRYAGKEQQSVNQSEWGNRALLSALALLAGGCVAGHQAATLPGVRVYQYSGEIQCRPNSGLSLTEMERPLIDAGLNVHGSYCAAEDLLSPAMCGLGTGLMGVFELSISDAQKAETLGYRLLRVDVKKTTCRY